MFMVFKVLSKNLPGCAYPALWMIKSESGSDSKNPWSVKSPYRTFIASWLKNSEIKPLVFLCRIALIEIGSFA